MIFLRTFHVDYTLWLEFSSISCIKPFSLRDRAYWLIAGRSHVSDAFFLAKILCGIRPTFPQNFPELDLSIYNFHLYRKLRCD